MKLSRGMMIIFVMSLTVFILGMGPPRMMQGDMRNSSGRGGPGLQGPKHRVAPPMIISKVMRCLHRQQLNHDTMMALRERLDLHRQKSLTEEKRMSEAVDNYLRILSAADRDYTELVQAKEEINRLHQERIDDELGFVQSIIDLLSEEEQNRLALCFEICPG